MPVFDYTKKKILTIWPGITGSFYHSDKMSAGHLFIEKGTLLPEHHHPHEQWTHVLEGEFEFTIAGETKIFRPGVSAYIPPHAPHSGKALTDCKVIDCFCPVREDFVKLEEDAS